eukprot:TRINITY_DN952_c0_g1_i1.p2 TRINITY_DN952_c0_g1~~TRINITY_DN952_c0_g1_i1.p2  ORF type:complete len:143 (-),score=43.85 TRINITY_DN952_c0_g1_i1:69-497(-)
MSVDSKFSLLQWVQTKKTDGGLEGLDIPLLSDLTKQMSTDYGFMCTPCDGATLRGSVLISDKGIVRHVTINDRPVGRGVDEALRLVKAFAKVDEMEAKGIEGVCPAGWVEGQSTMKPDPKGKLEWFDEKFGSGEAAAKKQKQ